MTGGGIGLAHSNLVVGQYECVGHELSSLWLDDAEENDRESK